MLTTYNHDRDRAGLRYIYPVLSRRSGGLSIGINLNINNACNWRCVYCQVPGLTRGTAPRVNLDLLGEELRQFLTDVIHGNFYAVETIPEEKRMIKDIAISGNGEATTSLEFDQVIDLVELVLQEYGLLGDVKCVLITNGSMVNRGVVQDGLRKLADINGEIWFKIDSATSAGIARINNVSATSNSIIKRLQIAAKLCPTWIQTCFFAWKKEAPSEEEIRAYLDLLADIRGKSILVKGVMLYGVARKSCQPAAKYISALPDAWYARLAEHIEQLGYDLHVTP